MNRLFDTVSRRLEPAPAAARPRGATRAPLRRHPKGSRSYRCQCGRPVFFRNSVCLNCQSALGFDPVTLRVRALVPGSGEGRFRPHDAGPRAAEWMRCANFDLAGCNWVLPARDAPAHDGLCRACRLNHVIPDLSDVQNAQWWRRIEIAKRRLVSQLLALGLPVRSRVEEDPQAGLMFDFLRALPGGPPVMTGHANGLVTINIEEADDARREQIRHAMGEPYRTLLGHFRHEVGHYYWDRLVRDTPWIEPFRARFGDERADYGAALQHHYEHGAPADWPLRCVSAYASTHPWEDWAETWAHYLHMLDTLDTALSFGLNREVLEFEIEPYRLDALDAPGDPDARRFLGFVNGWLELTAVMNEMSRSMGQQDFYPFVLSAPAVAKLHLVHRIVAASGERGAQGRPRRRQAAPPASNNPDSSIAQV